MSQISISLIIGSIFIITLGQAIVRHATYGSSIAISQILLACGLLYCVMKILTAWLGAPPPQKVEDENNDQQNQ